MSCGNRLHNGAHADKISAQNLQHANFCRGLKAGARELGIDALLQIDSVLFCRPANQLLQFKIINMRHIRKADALVVIIGSDERVSHKAADMIRQHDQRPRMVILVDSACRIGQKQNFRSKRMHDACRKHHL